MLVNNTFLYRPFEVERDFAALVSLLHDIEQIDQNGEDVSCFSQPFTGLSPYHLRQSN